MPASVLNARAHICVAAGRRIIIVESADRYVDALFSVITICDLFGYLRARGGVVVEPGRFAGMRVDEAVNMLPRPKRGAVMLRVAGRDCEWVLVIRDVFRVRLGPLQPGDALSKNQQGDTRNGGHD